MGKATSNDQETSIAGAGAERPQLGKAQEAKGQKRIFTGFGVAMLFVLGLAIFMYFNFRTVIVSGRSMFPTFKTGDKVLVCKAFWLVGKVKDGDVVVLTDPNPDGYIIKRVYRTAGETVDWKFGPLSQKVGPFTVPPGMIYVLGDNLLESFDSRLFGARYMDGVIGKVIANRRARTASSSSETNE